MTGWSTAWRRHCGADRQQCRGNARTHRRQALRRIHQSHPLPAILSVFRFEEWQANGKLVADPLLIEAVCVSLLGSRNANGAISQGRRPFTTIERDLFQLFVSTVLGDLAAAFTWVSDPVEVRLDRLETNPRFTYIAEMNDLVTVARLHINIAGDDDGRCDVVIPYSAFETRKEAYLRTTRPPTRRPPSPRWAEHRTPSFSQRWERAMTEQAAPADPADAIFERLSQFPPATIAGYLRYEAPATAAAILLQLPPEAAAAILNLLPTSFRHHALRCMADGASCNRRPRRSSRGSSMSSFPWSRRSRRPRRTSGGSSG